MGRTMLKKQLSAMGKSISLDVLNITLSLSDRAGRRSNPVQKQHKSLKQGPSEINNRLCHCNYKHIMNVIFLKGSLQRPT